MNRPLQQRLADLRARGAGQLDAVQLHYLERLNRRAQEQSPAVQRRLQQRLTLLLENVEARLAAPHAPEALPAIPACGTKGRAGPLAALTAYLQQQSGAALAASADAAASPWTGLSGMAPADPDALRAVRQAREVWAGLSADRQLAQALAQAPQNAGPIHSHRVLLGALARMHAIAPAYVQRFLGYAETLLCLAQQRPDTTGKAGKRPGTGSGPARTSAAGRSAPARSR